MLTSTIPTLDGGDENEGDVLCCSLSLIVAFSWMLLLNRSVSFFWPPEVVKIFSLRSICCWRFIVTAAGYTHAFTK